MAVYTTKAGIEVLVDDADFELISAFRWYVGSSGYAVRGIPHPEKSDTTTLLPMHRFILGLKYADKKTVDHIDGNRLNNSRSNLRICNNTQNSRNRRLDPANRSGYKGVFWNPLRNLWKAQIGVSNKIIRLGHYEDIVAAAHAYNKAAVHYFGEFAVLNPVDGCVEVSSFGSKTRFILTEQIASEIAMSNLPMKELAQLYRVSTRTVSRAREMCKSK